MWITYSIQDRSFWCLGEHWENIHKIFLFDHLPGQDSLSILIDRLYIKSKFSRASHGITIIWILIFNSFYIYLKFTCNSNIVLSTNWFRRLWYLVGCHCVHRNKQWERTCFIGAFLKYLATWKLKSTGKFW